MSDKRIVLVTGSNRGIGYEAVKLLSQKIPEGIILLASRSVENGESAIKKMRESDSSHSYDNIHVVSLDNTSQTSIDKAVEHVKSKYGRLDVLINNSGVASYESPEPDSPQDLEVNIRGTRNCTEAFLPLLPKQTGTVIIVSSQVGAWYMDMLPESTRKTLDDVDNVTWGKVESWMSDWISFSRDEPSKLEWAQRTNSMTRAYSLSKAILTAWSRSFAKTHKEIKLAIVCPGYCSTEMTSHQGPRPATQGGESITWPLFNAFESGQFYQDGKVHPFSCPMPEW